MLTRSASSGFESPALILERREEARGESFMSMGVPSSAVRGFCIARAGWGSEVVAKVRWVYRFLERGTVDVLKVGVDILGALCVEGARKSRYSDF
jgi:hypothetical protein